MKKQLLQLTVMLALIFQSCSKPLEQVKLEKYDITMTAPKPRAEPEFTDLKSSERDTDLSRYDFNIGKRINVIEIAESVYPTDINMLKKVVAEGSDYISTIETKNFPNGVFGIIYKMKGSNGSEIKNYLFYFKKGTRYFRMEPVFNSDLEELDVQLAAYESMK